MKLNWRARASLRNVRNVRETLTRKRGVNMETQIRKYWASRDKQSTVGSWDLSRPDHEIMAALSKLKDFRGEKIFEGGTIEIEEMWRLGCWEPNIS